jgi:hypothetical protein
MESSFQMDEDWGYPYDLGNLQWWDVDFHRHKKVAIKQ